MEAVGQLAGGIAHDFNNLLTAIIGYADLLESGIQADPSLRGSLGEIQRAAERAAGLTRQLLAFSRRQVLQSTEIEITSLVRDLIPMLRRLIGEHVSIQDRTTPNVGRVLGDRSQLEQVVINLVVNARDAMPTGGPITIATSKAKLDAMAAAGDLEPGQYLLLEVSDTGIGMDAATQSRIFEPFFTTKEIGYGTGLGLATVYGIVKQMNGAVRVQSDVGVGTTFRLYLPETTAKVSTETPLAGGLPGGTETLLLVEDDDAVRAFLTHTLETHGYQVIAAAHPSMAVALADSHDDVIHLLITDVVLPGSSGLELARALAERRPALQVLYISGYADATIARDGGVLKSMHFLQKPFSAGDLLRRIRQILPGLEANARPRAAGDRFSRRRRLQPLPYNDDRTFRCSTCSSADAWMFERYTERARRVLFFARYEATQLGSTSIETEHLLLGLIREGKGLTSRIFARSHLSLESIRKEIEGRTVFREKVSTSVDIPFSADTKRVLQFAAEEADRLLHTYIGTEHLLLGILREERSVAASILYEKGMRLASVREDIVQLLNEKTAPARPKETPLLAEFSRDLTEAAMKNQLDPLVGRATGSSSACSRCCAAARRTTPCSSASRASARRPSSRASRRRSSAATCRTSSPTSASSRSTSR